jgi:N-acetylglucosaminyldiphosphoundecaprenol N-acetyl-beta-D-mannosaminyltransferase
MSGNEVGSDGSGLHHAERREASRAVRNEATVNVLGVRIHSLTLADLLDEVSRFVALGMRRTVMYANVHVLNTAYGDPELRSILNAADVVYCDGFGVVLGARLLGGRLPGRMTGADWIYPFCEHCVRQGHSVYFLGGWPGVAERAAEVLLRHYPALRIVGTHHGYIHDLLLAGTIAAINAAQPDIVLVGMGTPTQEKWVAAHRTELDAPVCWTVGALFDYVAGEVPRGPRWMLDHGLEWLYRLYIEPRRLGKRYLIGNPLFLLRVLRQRIMGRSS